jgi:hypothetical protein
MMHLSIDRLGRYEAFMRDCELQMIVPRSVIEPRAVSTLLDARRSSCLYAGFMRRR